MTDVIWREKYHRLRCMWAPWFPPKLWIGVWLATVSGVFVFGFVFVMYFSIDTQSRNFIVADVSSSIPTPTMIVGGPQHCTHTEARCQLEVWTSTQIWLERDTAMLDCLNGEICFEGINEVLGWNSKQDLGGSRAYSRQCLYLYLLLWLYL